jgi:hypothetical protein
MKVNFHVQNKWTWKWFHGKFIWSWIASVWSLIIFLTNHVIFQYINILILCELTIVKPKLCKWTFQYFKKLQYVRGNLIFSPKNGMEMVKGNVKGTMTPFLYILFFIKLIKSTIIYTPYGTSHVKAWVSSF